MLFYNIFLSSNLIVAGRASYLFAELLTDVGALLSGLLHCLDLGLEPFHLELEILLALPALLHRHVAHLVAQTSGKRGLEPD